MNILLQSIAFLFLVILPSDSNAQHTILGDQSACYSDCIIYSIDSGSGGPYLWLTTGEIQGSNQGESIEICWNVIGENDLRVVDFSAPIADQSFATIVNVYEIPQPEILFPLYPTCVLRDTINPDGIGNEFPTTECNTVCSGSIVTYYAQYTPGNSITWEGDGASIVSASNDELTIQWDEAGSGFITITESGNGCTNSKTYCISILEPLEVDMVVMNGSASSISVCLGSEVYLQGLGSQEVTNFEWSFSNGVTQSGESTSISFDQPGTYSVLLTGTTECGCSETTTYSIEVEANPGPEITCTGTTCSSTEQTYYAANTCSTYNWTISANGVITDGGGSGDDYITINWGSGPVGTIGLSTSGCDEALCAQTTFVQIPILDTSAPISGPVIVCKEGYSRYSIQYYNGTEYTWSLAGNGTIIDGHGTNEITVEWEDTPWSDNQSTITVNYDNCYLECSGSGTLTIDLLPKFTIILNDTYCIGENLFIRALSEWNNATVDFEIITPSGAVLSFPNVNSISPIFTEKGEHTITASDTQNNYCNEQVTLKFNVVDPPPNPINIIGPTSICLNEFYNYSLPNINPNVNAYWVVRDGATIKTFFALTISYQWITNGPYSITVRYQNDETRCRSEDFVQEIDQIQNSTISGSDVVCVDEVSTYSLNIAAGNDADWQVMPSDAGTVIENIDNTIDIMWHTPGNHSISSAFCGASINYNITVHDLPSSAATFPEKVCSGETATIDIIAPSSTVIITDEDENIVSNTLTSIVDPGKYIATITNIFGCEEVIPIVIDTFLSPVVRVSSPQGNAFCLPHSAVEIFALETDDGYTYEWFRDDVSIGEVSSVISSNIFGNYHVVVTDINGCTAKSNIHPLVEWCSGDLPPGTADDASVGPISFTHVSLACNNLEFNVQQPYSSTSFTWFFSDPDTAPDDIGFGEMTTHEFSSAGFYYVFLFGNIFGERTVEIITVPVAPRFDIDQACVGSAVQFNNYSTFIPGHSIVQYAWDFGDPSSGASNTSIMREPNHIYTASGSYNVFLEVTGDNGCTSVYELLIEVEEGPYGEFVLPISTCSNEGLEFIALESDDIVKYEWDFADLASGDANFSSSPTSIHKFTSNGTYNVSLTVYDIDGCTTVITKPIDVTSTTISGEVTSNQAFPMCFGESAILEAPLGGDGYYWSNGETSQTITVQEAGIYSVTITSTDGCAHVPDPVNVVIEGIVDNRIRGTFYEDEFSTGIQHFDSLQICEGGLVSLSAQFFFGGTYTWSVPGASNTFVPISALSNLPPGRHTYYVDIESDQNTCIVQSQPFYIIVEENPAPVIIDTPSGVLCEGEMHKLSIDNPVPGQRYFWNTGEEGTSVEVSQSGYYFATAVNNNGCETESTGVFINARPDANRINLGCTSACFPDTICIPNIQNAFSYTWLKDGLPFSNALSIDLVAEEAGDYQLIVENFSGCPDTSDILTIDADPSDQSLEGLVFIDENNNGVWDAGEELLAGVPVSIYDGNTLVTTVLTDANGYYLFDPITTVNPTVSIDTTGLGLEITDGLFEEDVQYLSCMEDKQQNFPLIRNCTVVEEDVDIFVCNGETITINNIVLAGGDTWDFLDTNISGCDSISHIVIQEHVLPDVMLDTESTCENTDAGVLNISIMSGTGLQFAIDNPSSFSSDLTFDNLPAGNHTLWLIDGNGCSDSYPFVIEVAVVPDMAMITDNSCAGGNAGSIEVTPIIGGTYQYSLDGINFSPSSSFTDLSAATYTIYVQDMTTSCIHQYPTLIVDNPLPQFDISTLNTCAIGNTGMAEISPLTNGNFEYSIDGINFSGDQSFNSLAAGQYTLFVLEDDNCVFQYPVDITTEPEPIITLSTEDACVGTPNGQILINSSETGLEYSLDQVNYFTNTEITDLDAGMHTVFVLGENDCVHPFEIEIFETVELEVDFIEPDVDCSISEVVLNPEIINAAGNLEYTWSDGTSGSSLTASRSDKYSVEISDKCSSITHEYDIQLETVIEQQPIFFPNIFSPNQDGINECFQPSIRSETTIISYRLIIFDRWGNKYFETTEIDDCWNGKFNDQEVRSGVFVYLLELEYTYCVDIETITKYGDITIIH